jgi:hypothetical protein
VSDIVNLLYCSHCGAPSAGGNFCVRCGTRHNALAADWSDEVRYGTLVTVPQVRDQIARSAVGATARMTGEEFLGLCDMAFRPMTGVSLKMVATIAAPIYARLGVRTGKTRAEVVARPVGQVIVAALCSLARRGRPLKEVHQGEAGCLLEAVLPSDVWSFEGRLVISIERLDGGTRVEAVTTVPGQLFDWGKSTRCLDEVFTDVRGAGG